MATMVSAHAAATPRVPASRTTATPSAATASAESTCQPTSCGSAEKVRTNSARISRPAATNRPRRSRSVP
ncbi:Uncharacterised protein [Mycobacteroides abscessus subsp. abscessus]|nr:Uncharacterised protein [Mycobacteroides abscessus subsp. abscessus]